MVRDFYGAMNATLNFEAGYFITTGMFTLEAKHFADNKPIELIDGAKLMDYVDMAESRGAVPGKSVGSTPSKVPVCPKCGASMVLGTAKKGDKVSSQFWGCSTFPKCHASKIINTK